MLGAGGGARQSEEEEAAAAPPATMSGTRASNDRTSHPGGGGLKRARSEPGGNKVTVVLGAQWGDEGKGKVVDLLATESDVVCRCQVGPGPALTPLGSPSPPVPCFFFPPYPSLPSCSASPRLPLASCLLPSLGPAAFSSSPLPSRPVPLLPPPGAGTVLTPPTPHPSPAARGNATGGKKKPRTINKNS